MADLGRKPKKLATDSIRPIAVFGGACLFKSKSVILAAALALVVPMLTIAQTHATVKFTPLTTLNRIVLT